jgi:hypothetical protein
LNPRPRRHHRPTYSLLEVRLGLAILAILVVIAGWVAWRGAHPDPELFAEVAALEPAAVPVERGALPEGLAPASWREGPLSRFEAKNLYEKINGRADFFLSRGFKQLTFVSLAGESATTVDVEFYDMGSAENALGAFSGEKPPETGATTGGGTQWYRARNALFLARGPYYVRLLGADESPAVLAQLDHARKTLEAGLAAGERPWSHALFADALGVPADRITYEKENAFSFGFATNVYVALLPDGETEAFVTAAPDPAAAQALARQFEEGFLSYGEKEVRGGAVWVKDRYLSSYSRAQAEGSMVVGVRGAAGIDPATAALAKLRVGVKALPASIVASAGHPKEKSPAGEPSYQ